MVNGASRIEVYRKVIPGNIAAVASEDTDDVDEKPRRGRLRNSANCER